MNGEKGKKDERRRMKDECGTSPSYLSFSLSPPRAGRVRGIRLAEGVKNRGPA